MPETCPTTEAPRFEKKDYAGLKLEDYQRLFVPGMSLMVMVNNNVVQATVRELLVCDQKFLGVVVSLPETEVTFQPDHVTTLILNNISPGERTGNRPEGPSPSPEAVAESRGNIDSLIEMSGREMPLPEPPPLSDALPPGESIQELDEPEMEGVGHSLPQTPTVTNDGDLISGIPLSDADQSGSSFAVLESLELEEVDIKDLLPLRTILTLFYKAAEGNPPFSIRIVVKSHEVDHLVFNIVKDGQVFEYKAPFSDFDPRKVSIYKGRVLEEGEDSLKALSAPPAEEFEGVSEVVQRIELSDVVSIEVPNDPLKNSGDPVISPIQPLVAKKHERIQGGTGLVGLIRGRVGAWMKLKAASL